MALMQLTIIPVGTGSTSVGDYIAEFQKSLAQTQLSFQLTDMGTIIQGDIGDLLTVAARLHEMPFNSGAQRVVTQISIDDRRDKTVGLGDKIQAVQNRLESSQ